MEYLFDNTKSDTFGDALKYYLDLKGVSETKLADVLGRSPSYFTRLEKGERLNPSYPLVISIIFALGLDVRQANTLLYLAGYAPLQTISEYRPSGRKTWGPSSKIDSESSEAG